MKTGNPDTDDVLRETRSWQVSRETLNEAIRLGIVTQNQGEDLADFFSTLGEKTSGPPRLSKTPFDLAYLAYYFGAMIIISALSWLVVSAWEDLPGWGLSLIAAGYAAGFGLAGRRFCRNHDTFIFGGLLITIAVSLTPLFVYGIQKSAGLWTGAHPGEYHDFYVWIRSGWFLMELCTICVILAVMRKVRFAFLAAPLAFTLWFMSMDITPLLFGHLTGTDAWESRRLVSMFFGATMMACALFTDSRRHPGAPDYGFWLHLFGAMTFWGGLSLLRSQSEPAKAVYAGINVLLVLASVAFMRRIYLILGTLGVYGYLGHLAWRVFKDFILFPPVLVLVGIIIMGSGLLYHKNRMKLQNALRSHLPKWVRKIHDTNGDLSH